MKTYILQIMSVMETTIGQNEEAFENIRDNERLKRSERQASEKLS